VFTDLSFNPQRHRDIDVYNNRINLMNGNHPQPRIAMVTTVKNRTSHLANTLPRNLIDNADYSALKFIILDFGDCGDLRQYLLANHAMDMASGRIAVYRYNHNGPFEMGKAKNMAHRLGILEGADILVNLDADNYTGEGFASYIASTMIIPSLFLWSNIIPGTGKQFRGCNGRICVTRDQFINSGGYDEKFLTWSCDDKDFNARLQRMGYAAIEIDRQYLRAVPHKDGVRFKEYPHAQKNAEDYEQAVIEATNTVANFGRIGCGIVYRNYQPHPWSIDPLPTRIFGIGLHKTATNSLHKALTILGYDSAHWKSARWAKSIWKEMTTQGRSITLERNYALSDLPIGILYRQLDKAYPNSKFILTVRSEEDWIRSVRNHWDASKNEFRSAWDTDCFTHKLHKELYGQRWFDAEIFLARYRRHTAEVTDYFKSRPSDLLVMDMSNGAGWPSLCAFLHRPIPSESYPIEYATKSQ
jgi:sulfotransferase family protein/glycosyl transferase family 7 (putative galactosyltransferase)